MKRSHCNTGWFVYKLAKYNHETDEMDIKEEYTAYSFDFY